METLRGQVSLIGLGAMGGPMAHALVDAGLEPAVWNRTAAKAAPLAQAGAQVAATPADAARAVTLTVLAGIEDLVDVIDRPDGLLAGWRARGIASPILVVMGTVPPADVQALGQRLAAHGVRTVDAPVSGGVAGAVGRRLAIMVGAEPEEFAQLAPVLRTMGTTVEHVGALGAGQAAKTCNQVVVAATVAALAESFRLARAAGVDPAALQRLLGGGLAASEVLAQKGDNFVAESFEPGGLARYHLKDFASARALCSAAGITLPVTEAVASQFSHMVDLGLGDLDNSGVYRILDARDPEGLA